MQKTETSTDTVSSKGAPDSIESIRKQSKIPKKGLTRRSFLKASAFVAGTAAALGGVGCSSAESGADNGAADERIVATRCTWSGCANCQQNTTVRNGRVVKVDSVPNEPWGNRVCLRGRAQVQRVNNPNRLKYPMKRVGERGSGEWEQITWDEAISTVTNTWNDIIKQYGSKAIVNYSAVGNFGWLSAGLYTRLCNVMQFSKIDSSLDLAMPKGLQKVYGGSGYWMPAAEDPDNMLYSKYAVFWGTNVSEALMQLYRRVLDAQEAGTRIVVVSPIKSTVANIADLWVPVRTASDTILVSAMIKYIIEEELYDKDFITEHSNAPFLVKKDTYDQLRMSDMGVEPTEGPVNPTTRQPTIIDPGVVYDLDTKTFVQEGTVSNPALTGTWTIDGEECVTALDLLHETVMQYTPEYASPLCGIDPDTITELARICCDGPVLHAIANGGAAYDNGVAYGQSISILQVLGGQLGKPGMQNIVGAWFEQIYTAPEYSTPTGTYASYISILKLADMIETGELKGEPYPIKSIWCSGANYLSSVVESGKIRRALEKVDLLVTQDIAWTDTALYSDIVLPPSCSYENEDVQSSPPVRALLHTNKCVDAPFECKSDQDIVRLLAEGLGKGDLFRESDEEYLRLILENAPYNGRISLDRLREEREFWLGNEEEGWVINCSDLNFATDSGKAQIFCDKPTPRVDLGLDFDVKAEKLPIWRPPLEAWPDNEIMKKYPIILQSERARWRLQTCGFDVPWFNEIEDKPTTRLSVEDAEERGIKTGDYIEVFNDRGSVFCYAHISACVPKGVSVYPKGRQASQFPTNVSFSELSSQAFDPIAVNQSYFDTAVEIRKVEGGDE